MTDHRTGSPGENGAPVPRDLPDQQAQGGEDPLDVAPPPSDRDTDGDEDESAADVPDTDEAGTGRQGAPRSGTVHPEHPGPDESTA
ncbi:hypothetical protein ACFY93_17815 [Streptomyces sp. NPDC008313]|uniref:hypothetical protein n=1 Tax=Streptomyces sp. NPDC008313 TaxID=3364826 RepID=UPI0036E79E63